MEEALGAFGLYPPLMLAGGLGGVIRWWAAKDGWRFGVLSILAGAILGNYVGSGFFVLADQVARFSGMEQQAARLLGAHLSGVIGINLYAVPIDWIRARSLLVKASNDKEQQP